MATLHPEAAAALQWLHDFLRKVLKLAFFRLGYLCQSLAFGAHVDVAAVRQKVRVTSPPSLASFCCSFRAPKHRGRPHVFGHLSRAKSSPARRTRWCFTRASHVGLVLPPLPLPQVYETVEHAVYAHTSLLYNRHLDQLLLSALYGFCKVRRRCPRDVLGPLLHRREAVGLECAAAAAAEGALPTAPTREARTRVPWRAPPLPA